MSEIADTDLETGDGLGGGEDEAPDVNWSALGPAAEALAKEKGWKNPEEAFDYFRAADSERGKLRNDVGELRREREQLQSVLESLSEMQDAQQQPQQAGADEIPVDWDLYAQMSGVDVSDLGPMRTFVNHLLPAVLEAQEQRIRSEIMAEVGGQIQPMQRFVGASSLREEAADIQRRYPGALNMVGDRVAELMQSDEAMRRPGGMLRAFQVAWTDHSLAQAAKGEPVTFQQQQAGGEADLMNGGGRGAKELEDYAEQTRKAIRDATTKADDGF